MNIIGKKIEINQPINKVYEYLSNPANYEGFMPENISKFQLIDKGFIFALKSMPEVGLVLKEKTEYSSIIFMSKKENLIFSLEININELEQNKSEVQLIFNGEFNSFIKMMVEKPLKSFIETLSNNIESSNMS